MNTNNANATHEILVQGMTNIYDEVSTSVASAIKQDLVEHFGKLMDVGFTAQMEENLDKLADAVAAALG